MPPLREKNKPRRKINQIYAFDWQFQRKQKSNNQGIFRKFQHVVCYSRSRTVECWENICGIISFDFDCHSVRASRQNQIFEHTKRRLHLMRDCLTTSAFDDRHERKVTETMLEWQTNWIFLLRTRNESIRITFYFNAIVGSWENWWKKAQESGEEAKRLNWNDSIDFILISNYSRHMNCLTRFSLTVLIDGRRKFSCCCYVNKVAIFSYFNGF